MLSNYKKQFAELLKNAELSLSLDEIIWLIEIVPANIQWDLGFPCFKLAKDLKMAPNQIAQSFVEKINDENVIAVWPYVNYQIPTSDFAQELISEIDSKKSDFGKMESNGQEVVLEWWQPNTHKAFHIGHLRNALVWNGIAACMTWAGYKVHCVSYPWDIWAHVAKWIWYFINFTDQKFPEKDFGIRAWKLYSLATAKVDENPDEYKAQIQKLQKDLEDWDPKLVEIWMESREKCLQDFREIFDELDCPIEKWYFEKDVEKPWIQRVKDMLDKWIAQIGEWWAIIIDLEKYDLWVFLLLKSTWASLYSTKDIWLAYQKKADFPNYSQSLYIVWSEQEHHFQQLFKTLEIIWFPYEQLHHISYWFVDLKDGKMSSRAGNVIIYTELRDKLLAETEKMMETRNIPAENKSQIAKSVAFAAMKFDMLLPDAGKKILFDSEAALSFEWETGPYLQYTHARCCSLLKKWNLDFSNIDFADFDDQEKWILIHLDQFQDFILKAAKEYRPNYVARYLLDLSKLFNSYYNTTSKKLVESNSWLALVASVKQVLANGLSILGIDAPEEM